MAETSTQSRLLSSFGRRRGRKLRPGKQDLMDNLLSGLSIELPEGAEMDLEALFPGKTEYWLEIGFGAGEHLAHQASTYPHAGIIGCEPYIHGIAWLLSHIKEKALSNIRIYTQDARFLLETLPGQSLDKVFILYPDPWPKARHHKRRLISHATLDQLAHVMKPGAELRIATDDADYCTWILEQLLSHTAFTWQSQAGGGWVKPWADWISTRYEQKALGAGRVPTYLSFTRR